MAAAFYGLRPATVGLIAAAALLLMKRTIDYKKFPDLRGCVHPHLEVQESNPILMIILAGTAGMVLPLVNFTAKKSRLS